MTPDETQAGLTALVAEEAGLSGIAAATTLDRLPDRVVDLVILDLVCGHPHVASPWASVKWAETLGAKIATMTARARKGLLLVGSSSWINERVRDKSALGRLWNRVSGNERFLGEYRDRALTLLQGAECEDGIVEELARAEEEIFAILPHPDESWWPVLAGHFSAGPGRGVATTLLVPPLAEAPDPRWADQALRRVRAIGCIGVQSTGFRGLTMVIDGRTVLTGGPDLLYRVECPGFAERLLRLMQASLIRESATSRAGQPRTCPHCGWPVQVVNQRRRMGGWDRQPLKVGCTNDSCRKYLRDLDERLPLAEPPRCPVDGRTPYRRLRRGRGWVWVCPLHPYECPREKVVPGDPP